MVALLRCGAQVDLESKSGLTPLVAAAAAGKSKSVETLLKLGADPAYETRDGKTAAIEAVRCRQRGALFALYQHGAGAGPPVESFKNLFHFPVDFLRTLLKSLLNLRTVLKLLLNLKRLY